MTHNAENAAPAGFAAALIQLDDRDAIFEWTPCRPECGPCSCSGVPGFTTEMRSLLAERDARAKAEALREAADAPWEPSHAAGHQWLRDRADRLYTPVQEDQCNS